MFFFVFVGFIGMSSFFIIISICVCISLFVFCFLIFCCIKKKRQIPPSRDAMIQVNIDGDGFEDIDFNPWGEPSWSDENTM